MTERIENETQHARWNEEMVQKYDPDLFHRHQNPVIRWIETQRVHQVVRHIPKQADIRVLEVGCGAGNVTEKVVGRRVFGADLSRFILSKAKERLQARVPLVCGAAEHLPYYDGSFDCVFCTEVIEHTLEPRAVVAEMMRVLRPLGTLILSVPNEGIIDGLKSFIDRLGLYNKFFASGDFSSPKTNEWHLYDFDRQMLVDVMGNELIARKIVSIPFCFLPLRYVAVGTKPKDQ